MWGGGALADFYLVLEGVKSDLKLGVVPGHDGALQPQLCGIEDLKLAPQRRHELAPCDGVPNELLRLRLPHQPLEEERPVVSLRAVGEAAAALLAQQR
jgi:hypothetical protein